MLKFLKSLLTPSGESDSREISALQYNSYEIQPTPKQGNNGWTIEAIISKEVEGEVKTHHFIRADSTADQNAAIELTISKSKATLDQVGDRIFK